MVYSTLSMCSVVLAYEFPIKAPATKIVVKFSTAVIPPYQVLTSNGVIKGTAISLLNCTMRGLGETYRIDVFPWQRAQELVKEGEYDAFFVASENAERNQYAIRSEPFFDSKWNWYYLPDSEIQPTSETFSYSAKVGVVYGTNMSTWVNKNFDDPSHQETASSLIGMLDAKKIDAVLLTEPMFLAVMQKDKKLQNRYHQFTVRDRPLAAYFGRLFLKDNPKFLEHFNKSLELCQ